MSEEQCLKALPAMGNESLKRGVEGKSEPAENGKGVKRFKANAEEPDKEEQKKLPKRKVVLLMAYSGKGYHGMQVCITSI